MICLEKIALTRVRESVERAKRRGDPEDNDTFNTGNHWHLCPFFEPHSSECGCVVEVSARWWNTQHSQIKAAVAERLRSLGAELKTADERGDDQKQATRRLTRLEAEARKAFAECFRYELFNDALSPPATLVPLSALDVAAFRQLATVRVLSGRPLTAADLDEFSPRTLAAIDACIARYSATGVFAKTSFKSSKNDARPRPLHSTAEVLAVLSSSRDVLRFLDWATPSAAGGPPLSLVLLPWEPRIAADNEWRAFVAGGRVVALSQQRWFEDAGIRESRARDAAIAVQRLHDERLLGRIPFPDAVLDVWVDHGDGSDQHKETTTAHLIEVNPGLAWGSSGSSLFHWITDAPLLSSDSPQLTVRWVEPDGDGTGRT